MDVDWLTVSAQVVNFLVLVYLLKRFLYRPVLDAMDRRQREVADRLQQAERRQQAAEEERRGYAERRQALEQERDDLLAEARESARELREQLEDEAREAVEARRRHWTEALEHEQRQFLERLRREAALAITDTAGRVLRDLAERSLEDQVLAGLDRRLAEAEPGDLRALADGDRVTVRTAFQLDGRQQDALEAMLRRRLGAAPSLEVQADPSLGFGVELEAGGRRLGWHLAGYLETLERRVARRLEGAAP